MTTEEMERAIKFLLDHQATMDAKLETLTNNVTTLTNNVATLTNNVTTLTNDFNAFVDEVRQDREVITGALIQWSEDIPKVVAIADGMQDFARQVAKFVAQTDKRLTDLENR